MAKKKALSAAPLETTLLPAQSGEVLELDELWSFVGRRQGGVIWLWLALCRRTRQIVAYALGARNDATARLLYARIPEAYRGSGFFCTDHLESYHNVLPPARHQAQYATRGATNHVERFHNTLRQRLGRLTRKTLSFSKNRLMHEIVIRLFLQRYNLECADILN